MKQHKEILIENLLEKSQKALKEHSQALYNEAEKFIKILQDYIENNK